MVVLRSFDVSVCVIDVDTVSTLDTGVQIFQDALELFVEFLVPLDCLADGQGVGTYLLLLLLLLVSEVVVVLVHHDHHHHICRSVIVGREIVSRWRTTLAALALESNRRAPIWTRVDRWAISLSSPAGDLGLEAALSEAEDAIALYTDLNSVRRQDGSPHVAHLERLVSEHAAAWRRGPLARLAGQSGARQRIGQLVLLAHGARVLSDGRLHIVRLLLVLHRVHAACCL